MMRYFDFWSRMRRAEKDIAENLTEVISANTRHEARLTVLMEDRFDRLDRAICEEEGIPTDLDREADRLKELATARMLLVGDTPEKWRSDDALLRRYDAQCQLLVRTRGRLPQFAIGCTLGEDADTMWRNRCAELFPLRDGVQDGIETMLKART